MHSSIEKLLITARRLPEPLKSIFDGVFMQNESEQVLRERLGLSEEEFQAKHAQLLREMRCVARPEAAQA